MWSVWRKGIILHAERNGSAAIGILSYQHFYFGFLTKLFQNRRHISHSNINQHFRILLQVASLLVTSKQQVLTSRMRSKRSSETGCYTKAHCSSSTTSKFITQLLWLVTVKEISRFYGTTHLPNFFPNVLPKKKSILFEFSFVIFEHK
jgi:hypothetical protein